MIKVTFWMSLVELGLHREGEMEDNIFVLSDDRFGLTIIEKTYGFELKLHIFYGEHYPKNSRFVQWRLGMPKASSGLKINYGGKVLGVVSFDSANTITKLEPAVIKTRRRRTWRREATLKDNEIFITEDPRQGPPEEITVYLETIPVSPKRYSSVIYESKHTYIGDPEAYLYKELQFMKERILRFSSGIEELTSRLEQGGN